MTRRQGGSNLILIAVFLSVLFTPLFVQFFVLSSDGVDTGVDTLGENRILSKAPQRPNAIAELLKYPTVFEEYYGDNFGLRSKLLGIANTLKLLSGVSLSAYSVTGKENWSFLDLPSFANTIRGAKPLSKADLNAFYNDMNTIKELLQAQGITFVHFSAPEKQSIYPEYLPDRIKQVGPSHLDQVSQAFARSDNYVNVKQILLEAKTSDRKLYHELNTHWNCWGAYQVYRGIVQKALFKLGVQVPLVAQSEVAFQDVSTFDKKDVFAEEFWMNPIRSQRDTSYECLMKKDPKIEMHIAANGRNIPNINGEKNLPEDSFPNSVMLYRNWHSTNQNPNTRLKAIMIRDSFASYLVSYFNRTFSEVIYVHGTSVKHGDLRLLIEQFQPDVVIYEYAERELQDPALLIVRRIETGLAN